jgi:hypothetical protein
MRQSDILALLADLIDFLDNQSDVIDGPEGQPLPNKAMSLMGACEQAYEDIEKSGVANDI